MLSLENFGQVDFGDMALFRVSPTRSEHSAAISTKLISNSIPFLL